MPNKFLLRTIQQVLFFTNILLYYPTSIAALASTTATSTTNTNHNSEILNTMSRHYSSSYYTAKQNHPTTYEDKPDFKGPLTLKFGLHSTSDNRCRIQKYYLDNQSIGSDCRDQIQVINNNNNNEASINSEKSNKQKKEKKQNPIFRIPKEKLKPLKGTECTEKILQTIVDHLAYQDAPVDVKEVAESIEFYLRTRKRLLGAANKYNAKYNRLETKKKKEECIPCDDSEKKTVQTNIHVYDLCSGHGLTGILFAACNPPTKDRIIKTILVDQTEPPSFQTLSTIIGEVCPWLLENIEFQTLTLDQLNGKFFSGEKSHHSIAHVVIATHACGSLTDQVLKFAVDLGACGIAVMPCCYTGTDKGTPYGIKRALGVSWAADIRRCFYLNDNNYHSDFATIPVEITPMNRIIVAEDRS